MSCLCSDMFVFQEKFVSLFSEFEPHGFSVEKPFHAMYVVSHLPKPHNDKILSQKPTRKQ